MLRDDRTIVFDTDTILTFVIYDEDGLTEAELEASIAAETAVRRDITGWLLGFYVRRPHAVPLLLYKSNEDSPSDLHIVGSFGGSPDQTVEVTILDTDTYDPDVSPSVELDEGVYMYALKRLGDGVEEVLWSGALTITRTAGWE